MRPVGYLDDRAGRLAEDRKTVALIDRAMVDAGLRQKGTGRSIPSPTIREELFLAIAIACRRSVSTAVPDAMEWAQLPFRGGTDERAMEFEGTTLIDVLESICLKVLDGERFGDFQVEFDLHRKMADIDFWGDSREKTYLGFSVPDQIAEGYQLNRIVQIRGDYLRVIARSFRELQALSG